MTSLSLLALADPPAITSAGKDRLLTAAALMALAILLGAVV